jgi:hypothetical protein
MLPSGLSQIRRRGADCIIGATSWTPHGQAKFLRQPGRTHDRATFTGMQPQRDDPMTITVLLARGAGGGGGGRRSGRRTVPPPDAAMPSQPSPLLPPVQLAPADK